MASDNPTFTNNDLMPLSLYGSSASSNGAGRPQGNRNFGVTASNVRACNSSLLLTANSFFTQPTNPSFGAPPPSLVTPKMPKVPTVTPMSHKDRMLNKLAASSTQPVGVVRVLASPLGLPYLSP